MNEYENKTLLITGGTGITPTDVTIEACAKRHAECWTEGDSYFQP